MNATVIKSTGNFYTCQFENGIVLDCKVKGVFRNSEIHSSNPVAVGDKVNVELQANAQYGYITKLFDRSNYIIRKPSNWSKQVHILASNIDQVLLVCTLKNPETPLDFIDRFLVSAQAFRIPVLIVFNKLDLLDSSDLQIIASYYDIYKNLVQDFMTISVNSNNNIELLKQKLIGKKTLLSGNSGVGKSSIINVFSQNKEAKISEISDYHKTGKHTTSNTEMYSIDDTSFLIDSPGLKGFGIIQIDKTELYHFFPDIFSLSTACKFHNCLHINEPSCNVKHAAEMGILPISRYNSYLKMYFDDNEKYR